MSAGSRFLRIATALATFSASGWRTEPKLENDSIAIFAIQPDGSIEPIGWESTRGKKPRFFGPDPDWRHLHAANENSHITVESDAARLLDDGTEEEHVVSRRAQLAVREGQEVTAPAGAPTILITDDTPELRTLGRTILAPDYHTLVACDGAEAMAFLKHEGAHADAPRPDFILLDLNLPRKDGREVLAELKSDPELRHIPGIVLTTADAEQDVWRGYKLHANCYLTKPVHMDEFLNKIRSVEEFWRTIVRLPAH